jgi:hypothetical protein
MKYLFLLLLLAANAGANAQKKTKNADKKSSGEKIKWGPVQSSKGQTGVFHIDGGDFYRYKRRLFSPLKFVSYSNFLQKASESVNTKVPTGRGSLLNAIVVKDKMTTFLSDKNDGKNTLYMQTYSSSCIPSKPIEVFSYTMPGGRSKYDGSFHIIQSKDRSHFVVAYNLPGKKDEKEQIGFKVYDSEFEVVSEGTYTPKYEAQKFQITKEYLSNTGDYFISANIFSEAPKSGLFQRNRATLEKVIIMHITSDGVDEMDLALNEKEERFISDLAFSSDENDLLTFTGSYSGFKSAGTKGIFFFQLDFNKKEIINEGFTEFSKDFITQDYSERQKKRADRREAKGKEEPTLYQYDVREMHTLPNGEMIGLLEQFYITTTTTCDAKGQNCRTNYHYHYNDIIAYKINADGKFAWTEKILKSQTSTNDGGRLSSFASFISDGTLKLMFNDNLNNYNAGGKYQIKGTDGFKSTSYRTRDACVAKVVIDIESGDIERYVWFKKTEVSGYVEPKSFRVNEEKQEVLILVNESRKKAKFGLLSY